jgi:hypothetical protein
MNKPTKTLPSLHNKKLTVPIKTRLLMPKQTTMAPNNNHASTNTNDSSLIYQNQHINRSVSFSSRNLFIDVCEKIIKSNRFVFF